MKSARKYSDFANYFNDAEYVARRLAAIHSRITVTSDGCMEFPTTTTAGYAWVSFGRKDWHGHRLVWIIEHGDIGEQSVDHICRNRRCINLAHLQAVSDQENNRLRQRRRHGGKCDAGHDFVLVPGSATRHHCPTCKNAKERARYWAMSPEARSAKKRTRRQR